MFVLDVLCALREFLPAEWYIKKKILKKVDFKYAVLSRPLICTHRKFQMKTRVREEKNCCQKLKLNYEFRFRFQQLQKFMKHLV